MTRTVLVTGGAGFIGSHTCKLLARGGLLPVAFDNLSRGNESAVRWGPLVRGDIRSRLEVIDALKRFRPNVVIHFAALAYVGESVIDPALYYETNVCGMKNLLDACRETGVDKIVFSSSCATYGLAEDLPILETSRQNPINPYGRTKLIGEQLLDDYASAYGMRYVILRYFNASGADPEGEIGECHQPETHLIPRAVLAAYGSIDRLEIFGEDYPTLDGTCIRDYVHVNDLAQAHMLAIRYLDSDGANVAVNLGAGRGVSIREILTSVEEITARRVPIIVKPRRVGDPPALYADTSKASRILGFRPAMSDIDTIVTTASSFLKHWWNDERDKGEARSERIGRADQVTLTPWLRVEG